MAQSALPKRYTTLITRLVRQGLCPDPNTPQRLAVWTDDERQFDMAFRVIWDLDPIYRARLETCVTRFWEWRHAHRAQGAEASAPLERRFWEPFHELTAEIEARRQEKLRLKYGY